VDDWKKKLVQMSKDLFQARDKKFKETRMPAKEPLKAAHAITEIIGEITPSRPLKPEAAKPSVQQSCSAPSSTKPSRKERTLLPNEPLRDGDRITVGLDFGTSFTKICFRKELGGDDVPIYPLVFETLESPLYPSTVLIRGGRVYFGELAFDDTSEGQIYPHVKVCLECKVSNMSSNCVSAERCLYAEDGPTPAELMTLYLAWIMKQARQHVPSSLKKNKTSFVFNVGVPVKHLDEGEGGTLAFHYGKIVYDAWCLSDGLAQGIQMPVCQEWIHQLKGISPPEPANSPVQLATETSAAIVSYINSPDSKSGC